MKIALTCTAAAVGLCIASRAVAGADWGPQTVQVLVRQSDLDLRSEAGGAAMLRRIQGAARRACGGTPDAGSALTADSPRAWNACRAQAVRVTVARLNSPVVSRLYAASNARTISLVER